MHLRGIVDEGERAVGKKHREYVTETDLHVQRPESPLESLEVLDRLPAGRRLSGRETGDTREDRTDRALHSHEKEQRAGVLERLLLRAVLRRQQVFLEHPVVEVAEIDPRHTHYKLKRCPMPLPGDHQSIISAHLTKSTSLPLQLPQYPFTPLLPPPDGRQTPKRGAQQVRLQLPIVCRTKNAANPRKRRQQRKALSVRGRCQSHLALADGTYRACPATVMGGAGQGHRGDPHTWFGFGGAARPPRRPANAPEGWAARRSRSSCDPAPGSCSPAWLCVPVQKRS
jgi:hypothetical protein